MRERVITMRDLIIIRRRKRIGRQIDEIIRAEKKSEHEDFFPNISLCLFLYIYIDIEEQDINRYEREGHPSQIPVFRRGFRD